MRPGEKSAEEVARIRALFAAGKRVRDVELETGLAHSTVVYWSRKLGFDAFQRDQGKRPRLAALHAAGKVDSEIAAELGCTVTNVRQMRVRMGLPAHGKDSASFKARMGAAYRRRTAAAGVASLRQLIGTGLGTYSRRLAARYGLPGDLRKFQVRIVLALIAAPKTEHALADELGRGQCRSAAYARGYHRFNHASLRSGNYLTDLERRGLVVRARRGPDDVLLGLTPLALGMLAAKGGAA